MIGFIQVRERGATPGMAKRAFNNHSKTAWFDAAIFDHLENMPETFTEEFRQEGGFAKRRGHGVAFCSISLGRPARTRYRAGRDDHSWSAEVHQ